MKPENVDLAIRMARAARIRREAKRQQVAWQWYYNVEVKPREISGRERPTVRNHTQVTNNYKGWK